MDGFSAQAVVSKFSLELYGWGGSCKVLPMEKVSNPQRRDLTIWTFSREVTVLVWCVGSTGLGWCIVAALRNFPRGF